MLHKIVPDNIKKIVNIAGSIININTTGSINSLKNNRKLSVSPEKRSE